MDSTTGQGTHFQVTMLFLLGNMILYVGWIIDIYDSVTDWSKRLPL